MKSTVRTLQWTLFGLSLYALLLPEISGCLNTVLAAILPMGFPPETVKKWHITAGVTRDFADLRHSFSIEPRNSLSKFLFIFFHITVVVSWFLLFSSRKKNVPAE